MQNEIKAKIGEKELIISTGKIAKLAEGSCLVRYGDTVILSAVSSSDRPKDYIDMVPLTVEFRERSYSAGKIPGGFFKREGRPKENEILSARLIDRSIRPLFNPDLMNEIQVMNFLLSFDLENEGDVLSMVGSSAALCLTNIPFHGPIGAVRVGKVDGKYIINPTNSQMKLSTFDLVAAYSKEGVIMIEAGTKEVTNEEALEAIKFAKEPACELIRIQEELGKMVQKKEKVFSFYPFDEEIGKKVKQLSLEKLSVLGSIKEKHKRQDEVKKIKDEIVKEVLAGYPEKEQEIGLVFDLNEAETVRKQIIEQGKRPDGRELSEIRELNCEVGLLPRTHGSALFTRGQTQALVVTTLGTNEDAQVLDDLVGESKKKYMLHYNFPPIATGEVRPARGPGRREIGHGALAERALLPVIPEMGKFPYTINIVSDIMESNGSSSMASVCGASLSLMDAGVPITNPVAGISIGLIKETDKFILLTDIAGIEDHYGDMDFKVAGTEKGITAIQMDLKVEGISFEIIEKTLLQANEARIKILGKMKEAITGPRGNLSSFAPRIITLRINPDKIKDVIGPAGKNIKKIIEVSGAKVDIENDGTVNVSSADEEALNKALGMIKDITQEAEIGKLYTGKVKKIAEFGAFVEIFPGQDGLVHISEISDKRIRRVDDVLKEGQEVTVKVLDVDKAGKVRLSMKEVLKDSGKKEST